MLEEEFFEYDGDVALCDSESDDADSDASGENSFGDSGPNDTDENDAYGLTPDFGEWDFVDDFSFYVEIEPNIIGKVMAGFFSDLATGFFATVAGPFALASPIVGVYAYEKALDLWGGSNITKYAGSYDMVNAEYESGVYDFGDSPAHGAEQEALIAAVSKIRAAQQNMMHIGGMNAKPTTQTAMFASGGEDSKWFSDGRIEPSNIISTTFNYDYYNFPPETKEQNMYLQPKTSVWYI